MAASSAEIAKWAWDSREKLTKDEHMDWTAHVLKSTGLEIGEGNLPPTQYIRRGYYKTEEEDQLIFAITKPSDEECKCVLKFSVEDKTFGSPCIHEGRRKIWGDKKGRGFWYDRKADAVELAVGVGVRDMLSVKQANGMNVVASCDASGLRGLEFPDKTNTIHVCVTSDLSVKGDSYVCQRASLALAKRFENSAEGRVAWLVPVNDSCLSNEPEKANFNSLLQADPTGESIRNRFEEPARLADIKWEIPNKDEREESDDQYLPETLAALHKLNTEYACCMMGSDCRVVREEFSNRYKRNSITYMRIGAFNTYYANQKVPVPDGEDLRQIPVSKVWMGWEKRRSYRNVVFAPDEKVGKDDYNLFRGLDVAPVEGNWSLMKALVEDVICCGVKEHYDYLFMLMARMVQDPGGTRPGVAVVLRGKRGTGKGTLVNWFGKIFGSHFLPISSQERLTGRFNAHLTTCILLFLDEAFWAGSKEGEGTIKQLITEPVIASERKGIDSEQAVNHLNIFMASNEDWVAPVGEDERRFFAVDVSDEHMQDGDYFKAINEQMENGGIEAMLFDLMRIDVDMDVLRKAPTTEALVSQAELSFGCVRKFWREILSRGHLLSHDITGEPVVSETKSDGDYWPDRVFKHELINEFNRGYSGDRRYIPTPTDFWCRTYKFCPKEYWCEVWVKDPTQGRGVRAVSVPNLAQLRDLFTASTHVVFDDEEPLNDYDNTPF